MTTLMWRGEDSLHYFHLEDGVVLKGAAVLWLDGQPAHVQYRIECDAQWNTRHVIVHQQRGDEWRDLTLSVDAGQLWRVSGQHVDFADGLFDVDLEISPATNTLPIRRLNLKPGDSREVRAVWVRFPSLRLELLEQKYTRLDERRYRYESAPLNFEAMLEVDDDGFIVRYGDLWQRV